MVDIHRHQRRLEEIVGNKNLDGLSFEELDSLMDEADDLGTKVHSGCVVRSLESAFQVEATDKQWDEWFDIMDTTIELNQALISFGISKGRLRDIDANRLIKYVTCSLRDSQTPIGEALRRYDLLRGYMPYREILGYLDNEALVIMQFHLKSGPHLAHIQRQDGEVRMASDKDNEVMKYSPSKICHTLLFLPKY